MAAGPTRREPCMVAWPREIAFRRRCLGTRLGIRACPAGIWAALADPLINDRSTRCHTSAFPSITKIASTTLCAKFSANMQANTVRLSNLSDRYPVNGATITLGIMAAKVTSPTSRDESEIIYTYQPLATMRAHAAAPAERVAIQRLR